jgi:hypothetical protein
MVMVIVMGDVYPKGPVEELSQTAGRLLPW